MCVLSALPGVAPVIIKINQEIFNRATVSWRKIMLQIVLTVFPVSQQPNLKISDSTSCFKIQQ